MFCLIAQTFNTGRSESLKRVMHDWPGTRVFTAADSDDVRLAVRHIIHERPGYTLMGVSWGFGANILAKYLGEEAGAALLMAAVCISNPFDLEKSSTHLSRTRGPKPDHAMAEGLVNIVRENQVLLNIFVWQIGCSIRIILEFNVTFSWVLVPMIFHWLFGI